MTSVVLGTRASSSTSTVTCQVSESSSHSSPVAASELYPVSSSTAVMAARASSTADRCPLLSELAIALLSADASEGHQLVDELVFRLFDLRFGEVSGLTRQ